MTREHDDHGGAGTDGGDGVPTTEERDDERLGDGTDGGSTATGGGTATTDAAAPDADDRVVLAQGTFDLIHPGHLHYLSAAASHGDALHVVVARRENVTHKPTPVCPDRQRRDVLAALSVVDEAHVGHPDDYFVPVERIDPDVIVLGFDQHHDADAIRDQLRDRGLDCEVTRATAREPAYDGEILSTNEIVDRLVERREHDGE